MRKIQVLIVRLFFDSGLAEELRGTLQAVPEGKPQAFRGEESFLAILRQFSRPAAEAGGISSAITPTGPEKPG